MPPKATARRSSRERLRADPAVDLFPVILLTGAYLAAGYLAAKVLGWPVRTNPLRVFASVGLMLGWLLAVAAVATLFVLLVARAARWIGGRGGQRSRIASWADLRRLLTARRLAELVIVLVLYVLFIDTFIGFKKALPAVQPFTWDDAFMRLDRTLHLGRHPWEILQPLLGRPRLTDFMDRIYYTWFVVNKLTLVGFIWVSDRVLRTRFYISFWLVWIVVGTVLAYALSSAGPCFFSAVTELADPYQALMDYLRGVDGTYDLLAIFVQEQLWADYSRGTTNLLMKGISAMPSVHVALPILYTIAGWRVHRALGMAFAAFALLIFLGSIHLGWHYAVDGYVSALAVPPLWWISGALARGYYRWLDGARPMRA